MGKAYRFQFETVSVTVNLFDRVLSHAFVPAELLQGSALACMFLASKLHERHPLALRDISSLAGMAEPQKTVNELEMKILCLLRYDVNTFSPATCLAAVASCFHGAFRESFRELAMELAHLALKSACASPGAQAACGRVGRSGGLLCLPAPHNCRPPPSLTPCTPWRHPAHAAPHLQ